MVKTIGLIAHVLLPAHPRRTRFNAECKFNVACYDEASLAAMRNEWAWSHWIASGFKEYPLLHWAWTVPLLSPFVQCSEDVEV